MSPPLIAGVDASTTAVKCCIFDPSGTLAAEGRASIDLFNPEPLGYEQDADQWWTSATRAIRDAVAQIDVTRLAGLAIANQRETVVLTDVSGDPLAPALVWMDERCIPQVTEVRRVHDMARIHEISGKPVCATPSLYKLMWLRERDPSQFASGARALDVHAFLVHRLTGAFSTSLASADPMGLIDLGSGAPDWSLELVELTGLRIVDLPLLARPGARLGEVSAQAASLTGLPEGLPVFAGAGDGQAAGLGAGIRDTKRAYLNLGTALVSGVSSASYATDLAFRTLAGAEPDTYFLESDLKGGTFTLNWLRDQFGVDLDELERLAADIPAGSDGLTLLPYFCGVMNPHWDDDASGALIGLRGHHGPAHIYRAILEGLAMEQRLHTEGLEAALGVQVEAYVVMGGGSRSALWRQIIADVSGKQVTQAGTLEATALGAAMLAAVGAGVHGDFDTAVAAMVKHGPTTGPGSDRSSYALRYETTYRGLYSALSGLV